MRVSGVPRERTKLLTLLPYLYLFESETVIRGVFCSFFSSFEVMFSAFTVVII